MKERDIKSRLPSATPSFAPSRRLLLPLEVPLGDTDHLSFAVDWARTKKATLFLLHVVDFGSPASGLRYCPLVRSPEYCEKVAQRYLRRVAALESFRGTPVQVLVRIGNPSREIVKAAREICAESIVLRARQENWFSRWWSGDTAGWVEAHAPCSVVVLREANYGDCDCYHHAPHSDAKAFQRAV